MESGQSICSLPTYVGSHEITYTVRPNTSSSLICFSSLSDKALISWRLIFPSFPRQYSAYFELCRIDKDKAKRCWCSINWVSQAPLIKVKNSVTIPVLWSFAVLDFTDDLKARHYFNHCLTHKEIDNIELYTNWN